MFRKLFSTGGLLLVAGAVLFLTPASAWAQHGHFGGAHFGGAHFGGAHFGGAHVGGYHGGFYHGGYHVGYGHYHPHYGYHHDHGFYGHSVYNLYPYYGGAYGDFLSDEVTNPWYGGYYTETAPAYPDDTASATPPAEASPSYYASVTSAVPPDDIAHITVDVPPDAKVWFDGALMTSTGAVRHYDSPALTPGSHYTYEVKASWNENGHEVTQTQKVVVAAGAHVSVDFPAPPKTAGQASAHTSS